MTASSKRQKPSDRQPGCLPVALLFVAVGLGFGSIFAVRAWRDVRIFTVWRETTCTILSTDVGSSGGSSSSRPSYRPEITFSFEVGGREYRCTGWDSWALSGDYGGGSAAYYRRVVDRFEIGRSYPCWYDPADPGQAVLVKRIRPLYVLAVLPLAFLTLGAMGLWAVLAKPRSRPGRSGSDAVGRAAAEVDARSETMGLYRRLAVRLEPESKPGEQSCAALLVSLALLFVGGISGYAAWSEWQDGNVAVLPLVFLVVFGGLGLVFVWITAAAALASKVPTTILEIERRTVAPGEKVRALLLQPGPLRLQRIRVRLVCREEKRVRSGSPQVTILSDTLVTEVGFATIGKEGPLEHAFTVTVPEDARPSSGDAFEKVKWRLEVWGTPLVWPRFMLAFPITVESTRSNLSPSSDGKGEGELS